MIKPDRSHCPLTPSQQELHDRLRRSWLGTVQEGYRPVLLTGDVGVGKTFLARRLTADAGLYLNVTIDCLPGYLQQYPLDEVAPEAIIRRLKSQVNAQAVPFVTADGFEPLIGAWAVQSPRLLANFFLMNRTIFDKPLCIVVQTSVKYLHHELLVKDELLWPADRRFRLELSLADKETVARNWALDPVRAHMAPNLYHLLMPRLEG